MKWVLISLGVVFGFSVMIAVMNLIIWMQKDNRFRQKIEFVRRKPQIPLKPQRIETRPIFEENSIFTDVLLAA